MIGLSDIHVRRAADTADLCRELSREVPLPTIITRGKLAVSVGTDGTVFFYEFDGWVTYHAVFNVGLDGTICWVENDMSKSPALVAQKIDAYFVLAFIRYQLQEDNLFRHWCSITCWIEHGMTQPE